MKSRLLINLAAAVSLLLAVAIVFLWVRSHRRYEEITRKWQTSTEQRGWAVESRYGQLSLKLMRDPHLGRSIGASYAYYDNTAPDFVLPHALGWSPSTVGFQHLSPPAYPFDLTDLTLAYWLLLPPTLILPTIAFARHRRRRRREAGNLCPTCGYDLRAHAAGDRCPECGTSIQSTRGSCATQS